MRRCILTVIGIVFLGGVLSASYASAAALHTSAPLRPATSAPPRSQDRGIASIPTDVVIVATKDVTPYLFRFATLDGGRAGEASLVSALTASDAFDLHPAAQ